MPEKFRAGISRGLKDGESGVDRENNVIIGYSVISTGEAQGHDLEIDDTTLEQVVKHGNSHKAGIKSRFGHPNMSESAFGTFLGRSKNFVKDGETVRADLHIDRTAFETPKGDLGSYVMELADSDPGAFGASIVFKLEREFRIEKDGTPKKNEDGSEMFPLARVLELHASDIVDSPATGDPMFECFSDTVKPSAEMTDFLDKFLAQEGGVEKAYSFINRYFNNKKYEHYKDQIVEKLEEIVSLQENSGIKKHNYKFLETEETVMKKQENKEEKVTGEALVEKQQSASAAERKELTALQAIEILDTCKVFNIDEQFGKNLVSENISFADAKDKILAKAKSQMTPMNPKDNPTDVKVLADEQDKRIESLTSACVVNSNLERDEKVKTAIQKNGLGGMGMQKLAIKMLTDSGDASAYMYSPTELFEKTVVTQFGGSGATQGSGDFVNVLSNVLNKSVALGWNTTPSTFEQWVGTGNLKDFKQADLVRLSEIGDVERILEGEAPEMSKMTDLKEQARLETYGSKFVITRQALIDDDLSQLTTVPAKKMRALRRKMNKRAYGLIYDDNGSNSAFQGPTMVEKSAKMFNVTAESTAGGHNNLVAAGSGGVPTQATLDTAFFALSQHRALTPDEDRSDPIFMDTTPRFILIGHNVQLETFKLMKNIGYNVSGEDSAADGTLAANISGPGGPRNLQIVADAEIDNLDDTYYPWYLAADPLDVGTVTLYTLTGNTTPFTDTAPNPVGDARGIIWVVEHDFVFATPDWRGMFCNSGPTK